MLSKGKSGGSRPQCRKVISGKSEVKSTKVVRCKMPLTAEGKCPIHGFDTN